MSALSPRLSVECISYSGFPQCGGARRAVKSVSGALLKRAVRDVSRSKAELAFLPLSSDVPALT